MTIRVGDGQTPSGKILDGGTHWYNYNKKEGIDEREEAVKYSIETGRDIYVSVNNKAYQRMTIERLRRL